MKYEYVNTALLQEWYIKYRNCAYEASKQEGKENQWKSWCYATSADEIRNVLLSRGVLVNATVHI